MKPEQNISFEEFEKIESYFAGRLAEEEMNSFKKKLETDEKFRIEVERQHLLQLVVEENALRDDLENFHRDGTFSEADDQLPQDVKLKIKRFWLFIVLAVLLAIAAVFLLWPEPKEKHEYLYASYFEPDPGLATKMGMTDNYSFDLGMVSYKQGKYDEAIEEWNLLLKNNPKSDTINYFYGIALLADGNHEEAIIQLTESIALESNNFRDENHYYLGCAFLKTNDLIQAKKQFSLSQHPNAKLLLEELK